MYVIIRLPELTSRKFLEPDSLKDGLHLKFIWRGAERCKYIDWVSKSAAQTTLHIGRGYKEKAWSSRTGT